MAHAYGSRLAEMLDGIDNEAALGADLGGGLTELEARWLHDREWARSTDDVLLRRTKLGLHLSAAERTQVERWWTETFPTAGGNDVDHGRVTAA
jgi:glycerol-3-phosphate dehydrogenase